MTWLPTFRSGSASGESIDGFRGTKGRYFQIDWLGLQLTFELARIQS